MNDSLDTLLAFVALLATLVVYAMMCRLYLHQYVPFAFPVVSTLPVVLTSCAVTLTAKDA